MQDQFLVKSLFGEGPLPGLQTAFFSLCPHMAKREKAPSDRSSSYKNINPIMGTPSLWPHLNLIMFQRTHLQIQIPFTSGLGLQHMSCGQGWGDEHSVHNSYLFWLGVCVRSVSLVSLRNWGMHACMLSCFSRVCLNSHIRLLGGLELALYYT